MWKNNTCKNKKWDNIFLLNAFTPTENAEKADFYEEIETEMSRIPKEDAVLLSGNFNVQIGTHTGRDIEHIAMKPRPDQQI